jgi:hypothetical protein
MTRVMCNPSKNDFYLGAPNSFDHDFTLNIHFDDFLLYKNQLRIVNVISINIYICHRLNVVQRRVGSFCNIFFFI